MIDLGDEERELLEQNTFNQIVEEINQFLESIDIDSDQKQYIKSIICKLQCLFHQLIVSVQ